MATSLLLIHVECTSVGVRRYVPGEQLEWEMHHVPQTFRKRLQDECHPERSPLLPWRISHLESRRQTDEKDMCMDFSISGCAWHGRVELYSLTSPADQHLIATSQARHGVRMQPLKSAGLALAVEALAADKIEALVVNSEG